MIRAIVIGLLASAATITAELGTRQILVLREQHAASSPQRTTEARKTHEINVPRIKDGVVKVKLVGHCAGCPMSMMTLKNGIERMLKQEIPEVKQVIAA